MKERAKIKVMGLSFVCEQSAFKQYKELAEKQGFQVSITEIGGQPHSFQEDVALLQKPKEIRYAVPEGHVKTLFSATPGNTMGYYDFWKELNRLTWQIRVGKTNRSASARDVLIPAKKFFGDARGIRTLD